MSVQDEDHNITTIVRRYSNQVGTQMTGSILALALTEHEAALQAQENEAAEWRKWLQFDDLTREDDETSGLQKAAKEAAELWRKLKLDVSDASPDKESPPSIRSLWTAVSEAQETWETRKKTRLGRTKERFSTFLETMDAHKYLFSVIPNGDKYTSLLVGVISTIVKASTNHEHIADGFSEALDDMSRDMHLVQRMSQRCDTPKMRQNIISLYGEVFALLCDAMVWYQSLGYRFRKAFNNKFYDKAVKERVTRIQKHIQRVRDELSLLENGMMEAMHERQLFSFNQIDQNISSTAVWLDARIDQKLDALARRLLGRDMSHTLYANAEQDLAMRNATQVPINQDGDVEVRFSRASQDPAFFSTKQQLEAFLPQLGRFTSNGTNHSPALDSTGNRPLIPSEVAIDLQRWLASHTSDMLWIESPAYAANDSEVAQLALRVTHLAKQINIPCVDCFISKVNIFDPRQISQKETSLIVLIYCLLTKLIMAMPTQWGSLQTLSGEQFEQLDGTLKSIPVGLEIIRRLLEIVTPGLIVVLYGLDLVDGRSTCDTLVELIQLLLERPEERRVKLLVASRGKCISLLKTVRPSQRSDATRMVLARDLYTLPGGVHAREINLRATSVTTEENGDSPSPSDSRREK